MSRSLHPPPPIALGEHRRQAHLRLRRAADVATSGRPLGVCVRSGHVESAAFVRRNDVLDCWRGDADGPRQSFRKWSCCSTRISTIAVAT
eukprot:CAMPEP_0196654098 /NCGR_PEP_ID=MMETSP1086-20130531/3777_1 /TAXON_ID=77921 /ORGANISM="Cyanoptyche  gloeocystis , Strain SAG4.97" /LENGTH=89 /DNA_ID=CAMNT_0041985657 /DNA_START=102 /DNA_END=371 /DNA_ORIENTATION=-